MFMLSTKKKGLKGLSIDVKRKPLMENPMTFDQSTRNSNHFNGFKAGLMWTSEGFSKFGTITWTFLNICVVMCSTAVYCITA